MSGDDVSDEVERRLKRLLDRGGDAEYELDLCGLDLAHSLASIDRMVERQRFREEARDVRIRIDPASESSGETLFQPIGRHLLDMMKRDLILRCVPLPNSDGAGFHVLIAGKESSV